MRKIISPCGFHCIKVNHLGVWFSEQEILKDVNLHMHCGSLNAIIGKNGAGKSTLIRAMLGDIPHTGDIEFRDTKDGRMQNLKIGYVPQSINMHHKETLQACPPQLLRYKSAPSQTTPQVHLKTVISVLRKSVLPPLKALKFPFPSSERRQRIFSHRQYLLHRNAVP